MLKAETKSPANKHNDQKNGSSFFRDESVLITEHQLNIQPFFNNTSTYRNGAKPPVFQPKPFFQPKLKINQAGNSLQESANLADNIFKKPLNEAHIQKECTQCINEEMLQKQEGILQARIENGVNKEVAMAQIDNENGLGSDFGNSFDKEVIPVSDVSTSGNPVNYVVFGENEPVSISLHGTTEPNFDGGTGSTSNISTTQATGCDECTDDECLNVSGTLTVVFNANPVITLPPRSEYEHLRPCQIQRVEQWIQDVLAPHEQEHADAFNTYDGTVARQFQLKICRSDWNQEAVQPFHDKMETERRANAQALSDALDPFHTNIDLDCEDD